MFDTEPMHRALKLAVQSEEFLKRRRDFIKCAVKKADDKQWGYDRYIGGKEKEVDHGLFGTACAVSALICCGENRESEHVTNCLNLLKSPDFRAHSGGIATRTINKLGGPGMVNAACYVLWAHLAAGRDPALPDSGKLLDFLVKARGVEPWWGHFPGDTSYRLSATCNAIATVAKAAHCGSHLMVAGIDETLNWLRTKQDPTTGAWLNKEKEPDAGFTALAVLALAEAQSGEPEVRRGIGFLRNSVADWRETKERFQVPAPAKRGFHAEHYRIHTQAIGVSALLRAGDNSCDKAVLHSVSRLLASHVPDASVEDPARGVPAWEVMYECRALRDFIMITSSRALAAGCREGATVIGRLDELERKMVTLSDRTRPMSRLGEFESGLANVADRVEALESQPSCLGELEDRLANTCDRVEALENQRGFRYQFGRFLRPLVRSGVLALAGGVVLIVAGLCLLLLLRGTPSSSPVLALLVSAAGVLVGLAGLWQNRKRRHEARKEKGV